MTTLLVSDAVRAAFPFTVDKLPLYGPKGLPTPHYGLFRSDNGAAVGVAVRQGYEPHTVDDVCALAEAAAGAFDGSPVIRTGFNDAHYVNIRPSIEYRRSIFGTDTIWPELTIRASYDGRAFWSALGYYRDACRNMAIIRAVGHSVSANIRHTLQLRDKLADLRRTFVQLVAGWDRVVDTAQAMDSRQLNLAEFIRQVYPMPTDATERTRNASERRVESIVRRIVAERQVTGRPALKIGTDGAALVSAWEAFNGVQGYVQHDSRRHGRPDAFTRAIVAIDDPAAFAAC